MKNLYFSAGEYCATSFQIRRISGRDDAYFFDWLVTRDDSFNFLSKSNYSFFQSGNWEIVDGGIRVLDKYSRLLFQHEFKTIDSQSEIIDPNAVEAHLQTAFDKFVYLKNKLIIKLRESERVVVIRAENTIKTADQAKERLRQLNNTFLPINQGIKFIVASTQLQHEEFMPDYLIVRLNDATASAGKDYWKGDNESFDRLFELAEKTLIFNMKPFKLEVESDNVRGGPTKLDSPISGSLA